MRALSCCNAISALECTGQDTARIAGRHGVLMRTAAEHTGNRDELLYAVLQEPQA